MPRPKSIPWRTRAAIFLDYRRQKRKVYPVAKLHNVARSTVSAIVLEFEAAGFSAGPRPKVSEETLRQLQERHLLSMIATARQPSVGIGEPIGAIGNLDISPASNEQDAQVAAGKDPLYIDEHLAWHLKDTGALQVFQEAREAARHFHEQDYATWRDLRITIENHCGMPVKTNVPDVTGPCVFVDLVSFVRHAFFTRAYRSSTPSEDWVAWTTDPNDARYLRANGQRMAIGTPDDHERVQRGIGTFREREFKRVQQRFLEVDHLRRDLGLLEGMLVEAFKAIKEADIRQGMCPRCPYPEARTAAVKTAPRRKPVAQRKGRKR